MTWPWLGGWDGPGIQQITEPMISIVAIITICYRLSTWPWLGGRTSQGNHKTNFNKTGMYTPIS